MSEYLEDQAYTNTLGEALAAAPIEATPTEPDDGLIHLSTAVVLKPKKVSPFAFQAVAARFKDPKVPEFYNENKGRNEPNPMHPDYLQAVTDVEIARSMATIDATIALGTTLVSVPQGFPNPDDDDWLDDLEAAEIIIDRSNKRLRYRTWVKFVAAPSVQDVQTIISKVLKNIGVTDEEVAKATASFQHQA